MSRRAAAQGARCSTICRLGVAVAQYVQSWLAGCFEQLADYLRAVLRLAVGRASEPTDAVLDSRRYASRACRHLNVLAGLAFPSDDNGECDAEQRAMG